jgi:hypothetical protein
MVSVVLYTGRFLGEFVSERVGFCFHSFCLVCSAVSPLLLTWVVESVFSAGVFWPDDYFTEVSLFV